MMLVFSDPEDMKSIASLLEQGIVKAHVSKIFDFEDIQAAHTQVESGTTAGKIVVRVS